MPMDFLTESESQLWVRFKNGDDKAFSAIYSAYTRKLYQYGLRFTRNRSLIEDSIQDMFLELIRNRRTIGQTNNILGYLLTSFRRKLIRRLRQESRYDLRDDSTEYAFEILCSHEHELILSEDSVMRTAASEKALQGLTARQKEAVYLKFTSGLEYEEVCAVMEMNLESCRNLIYRAVKALREAVGTAGPEKPAGPASGKVIQD